VQTVVVGTKNRDKLREIEAILVGVPVVLRPLDADVAEVEETGETLEENSELKAREYARRVGAWCLADDTGLEVDALDGRPGVRAARYAGPDCSYADNRRRLLEELKGLPPPRRTARFRCVVSLANPAGEVVARAEGALEGVILEKERGEGEREPHGVTGRDQVREDVGHEDHGPERAERGARERGQGGGVDPDRGQALALPLVRGPPGQAPERGRGRGPRADNDVGGGPPPQTSSRFVQRNPITSFFSFLLAQFSAEAAR